jgi:UDPglucose 6-dehydrogenase
MARLAVAGLWHQGLVLAASLAALGHDVRGLADDAAAATALSGAVLPLYEPGLADLVREGLETRRLRFTAEPGDAVTAAEFVFLSLDTPVGEDDRPVLQRVFDLARRIGRGLSGDVVLCVTAQVPVGTTEELTRLVAAESGRRCDGAYVPEFLRLGTALDSFRNADRFVVGAENAGVAERVANLFRPLDRPIVVTDVRTAELAKHAANAFLATSISFANELSDVAQAVGADYRTAAEILRLDPRIGAKAFLEAGPGFAGGTLGREVRTLQSLGAAHGLRTPLLDAVIAVNSARSQRVGQLLERELGTLASRVIALLGLTYKPGTSTLRRAVSLEIARDLVARGATVRAFDPLADLGEAAELPPMHAVRDPYSAADGADAVVLVTPWSGLDDLDLGRLRDAMRGDLVLDTRAALDATALGTVGLRVIGV